MTTEERTTLKTMHARIVALASIAEALSRDWDALSPTAEVSLAVGYPFADSFDEVAHNLHEWAAAQAARLQ